MATRFTPRLTTFNYVGQHGYSLTCCTFQRRRVFAAEDVVAPVLAQILRIGEAQAFAVLAYCFMPDHLHLVVSGQRLESDLRSFMNRLKQTTGHWYGQRHPGDRLWQRSYWDRVLRRDDDVHGVIRYVLANPVRAGLAARPAEYPFSGSAVYGREALARVFDGCPAG